MACSVCIADIHLNFIRVSMMISACVALLVSAFFSVVLVFSPYLRPSMPLCLLLFEVGLRVFLEQTEPCQAFLQFIRDQEKLLDDKLAMRLAPAKSL